MRFIHTADLHLDAPTKIPVASTTLRRGGLDVLRQMIQYAENNSIGHIVIAGDLFDTNTPGAHMLGAVREMMAGTNVRFWIAAGNHDALIKDKYLGTEWPENVYVFGKETESVTTPDGVFVGVSFYEGMSVHPLGALQVSTPVSVGVFHGSVGDSTPAYSIDEATLRQSGLGYIALGHIHKPADPAYVGGSAVGTCGSPVSHGFDELGERSFLDVEIGAGQITHKRVITDCIRFWEQTIEIDEQLTSYEILGKLMVEAAKYGEKDIFRFRLRGKTACALPETIAEYPMLVEIIDETSLPISVEKLRAEQSLRGYFAAAMLDKIQNAPPQEKHKYEAALRLGLEAFE